MHSHYTFDREGQGSWREQSEGQTTSLGKGKKWRGVDQPGEAKRLTGRRVSWCAVAVAAWSAGVPSRAIMFLRGVRGYMAQNVGLFGESP